MYSITRIHQNLNSSESLGYLFTFFLPSLARYKEPQHTPRANGYQHGIYHATNALQNTGKFKVKDCHANTSESTVNKAVRCLADNYCVVFKVSSDNFLVFFLALILKINRDIIRTNQFRN